MAEAQHQQCLKDNVHLDLVVAYDAGRQQVNSIWVEAGPTLAGALLQAGLVDELPVYVAPKLLGMRHVVCLCCPA